MKGTKEIKTNKGITLIALVITIIVMLILVGVTIKMTVDGGLFEQAGKAVSQTNEAMIAEQELSKGTINVAGTEYASIDDYLIKNGHKTPTVNGEWVFNETITWDEGLNR